MEKIDYVIEDTTQQDWPGMPSFKDIFCRAGHGYKTEGDALRKANELICWSEKHCRGCRKPRFQIIERVNCRSITELVSP